MSTDIIEIALDRFTDWPRFEGLAAEIMRAEGYADIKILGGVQDEGQDAIVERFYEHSGRRTRTVFQFSLQADVGNKVGKTIERLQKARIEFNKLVIVTPIGLSAEKLLRCSPNGSDWAFSLQDGWQRSEGHSVLETDGDAKGRAARFVA